MNIVVSPDAKVKTNKNDLNESIWLATDSEWDCPSQSWISITFSYADKVVIFVRNDLPEDMDARF